MGQEYSDKQTGQGRAAKTSMVHPRCEGCGFTFTGSPKVLMCEGGEHPRGGNCEFCLSGALKIRSSN